MERIEPGHDLACPEDVADIDGPLDHPSVEAKREADLVLGAHLAGQRNGLAFRAALDGNRPDRPVLRTGWYSLFAARDGCHDQHGCCNCYPRVEHWSAPLGLTR